MVKVTEAKKYNIISLDSIWNLIQQKNGRLFVSMIFQNKNI